MITQDVLVAADMTVAPDATARVDRQLYRVPLINQITSGGAAVVLGLARAAIEETAELSRVTLGPDGLPLAQQPRVVGQARSEAAQHLRARGARPEARSWPLGFGIPRRPVRGPK
ncbi:hypothetical protein ACWCPT_25145 [Streptomyces sp. NPDC002308]